MAPEHAPGIREWTAIHAFSMRPEGGDEHGGWQHGDRLDALLASRLAGHAHIRGGQILGAAPIVPDDERVLHRREDQLPIGLRWLGANVPPVTVVSRHRSSDVRQGSRGQL